MRLCKGSVSALRYLAGDVTGHMTREEALLRIYLGWCTVMMGFRNRRKETLGNMARQLSVSRMFIRL